MFSYCKFLNCPILTLGTAGALSKVPTFRSLSALPDVRSISVFFHQNASFITFELSCAQFPLSAICTDIVL